MTLEDANGNVVTTDSTTGVTLSLNDGANSGTLSGTLSQTATSGVATFGGLSIDKAGTGYTLTATAAGYGTVKSSSFSVTAGSPSVLAFTTQPGSSSAGGTSTIAVTLEDAQGNAVSDSSTAVTLSLNAGANAGTLSGTLSQTASNGVASFGDLSIDKAGTGYTLTATASGYGTVTSNAFNVVAGSPSALVFTGQPVSTVAADATLSVAVTLKDAEGDTIPTSSTVVTMALVSSADGGAGSLSGTLSVTATSGIATFGDSQRQRRGDRVRAHRLGARVCGGHQLAVQRHAARGRDGAGGPGLQLDQRLLLRQQLHWRRLHDSSSGAELPDRGRRLRLCRRLLLRAGLRRRRVCVPGRVVHRAGSNVRH